MPAGETWPPLLCHRDRTTASDSAGIRPGGPGVCTAGIFPHCAGGSAVAPDYPHTPMRPFIHLRVVALFLTAAAARAGAEGVDTFITGEGPHHSYTLAEELGVHVFYAGHYATETFGVKALAAQVAKTFRVPWEFIDHPTAL